MKKLLLILFLFGFYFFPKIEANALTCTPSSCTKSACTQPSGGGSCQFECIEWQGANGPYCGWRCNAQCPSGYSSSCPSANSSDCEKKTVQCPDCNNPTSSKDCYKLKATPTQKPSSTPTPTPKKECGPPYCDTHLGDCKTGYKQESKECRYVDHNGNQVGSKFYESSCGKTDLCKKASPSNTPKPSATKAPSATPKASNTPKPSNTPGPGNPSNTPKPSNTPGPGNPSNTPKPSNTPGPGNPSNTPGPSSTPRPSNTPQPTATPAPPTATPTPDWDPNACVCDGWENTAITSGAPATFSVFGKVENPTNSNAMIKDFTFTFAKGTDYNFNKIAGSGPIPASPLPQSNGSIRYKSDWRVTMPQLESGVVYTVWARPNCVKRTTALNTNQSVMVMGQTDKEPGFFGRVWNFVTSIFGFGSEEPETQQTVNKPTPTITNATPARPEYFDSQAQIDCSPEPGLQLCTFKFAEVIEKGCFIMRFKME